MFCPCQTVLSACILRIYTFLGRNLSRNGLWKSSEAIGQVKLIRGRLDYTQVPDTPTERQPVSGHAQLITSLNVVHTCSRKYRIIKYTQFIITRNHQYLLIYTWTSVLERLGEHKVDSHFAIHSTNSRVKAEPWVINVTSSRKNIDMFTICSLARRK